MPANRRDPGAGDFNPLTHGLPGTMVDGLPDAGAKEESA
jgi:hypothetical protein